MSIDKKISSLVENQFPDFYSQEGSNFISFLEAYYEWMEQEGNTLDVNRNLLNYQDIDETTTQYINYFKREIMASFPNEILADKALLMKHIEDFYLSKGSEKSYNLLFRILFNEDIDFYYPGEDILRASDGRWVEESSVRVSGPSEGDVLLLSGETVTGSISGASGRVERIARTIESGIIVIELFLVNITGSFQDGERIENEDGSIFFTVFSTVGPINSITNIIDGGAFHRINDDINISSTAGAGATARVTSVNDNSAIEFVITNPGSGYTVNSDITVTGGSGQDADFRVETITNTEFISLNSDPIYPMRKVLLNESPTFTSNGDNTAPVNPDLASANIDTLLVDALTYTNTEVGEIGSIVMLDHGFGYGVSFPAATAVFTPVSALDIPDPVKGGFKGRNAKFKANNVGGTIDSLDIVDPGISYNINQPVALINSTRAGTDDGSALVDISGIINYSGQYIDTKGWLSWNNRLQDNYYYQTFSYEIISKQFINAYREIVNSATHPAGTKLFGRVQIEDSFLIEPIQIDTEVSIE